MSELINKAKENVPKVYESGRKIGHDEGIEEGYDNGKQAEYNAFWDTLQDYGNENGRNYYYAFSYNLWNDTTFNPKYPLIGSVDTTTGTHSMFYGNTLLTDTKMPIIVKSRNLSGAFYRCRSLVNIRELNVNSKVAFAMSTFQECNSLINLNITGTIGQNGFDVRWSTLLNKASIESIINALSTTTSGLTVILSQTAVDNAFTPEEWEALEATKTNWNISLFKE